MSENIKLVPKRRFKEFKNTEAWEQRKLSDMTEYKNGRGHEDRQSSTGKYELVNLNSISLDGGLKHSGKFVDDTTDTLLQNDLVMILSDVGHGDLLGRVALIPENDRFVLNQRVALLRPNNSVDPQFLFSHINAHQQYFKSQGAGMSQLNISKGTVENFISLVPHKEEQIKIGDLFLKLENLITLHQRKLEKMKALKTAYLSEMFPAEGERKPKRRFKGFENAWEQRKLKQLANFTKGQGYSKSDLTDAGTPVILYGRLYTKYQSIISEVDTFVVPKIGSVYSTGKEVIVPASGETAEDIARASAVVKSGILLGGDLNIIYPNKNISTIFLALSISNGQQQKELAKKAQGKSVVHLHNGDLEGVTITYPCKEEQEKIESVFSNIDNLITLHQRNLEKLQNIKNAYLNEMFVGGE